MRSHRKPHPDFPLTPCPNGQWRKIIKGKPHYFGSWRTDPQGEAAIRDYLARKDTILAGLETVQAEPPVAPGALTLGLMVKKYLTLRSGDVEGHRLSPDTFRDYAAELNGLVALFGPNVPAASLSPTSFTVLRAHLERRRLGPHAMKRAIACIRAAFNFATEEGWIPPLRFGRQLVAPNTEPEAVALRKLRSGESDRTDRILNRRDVRHLMRATKDKQDWRALCLLMLNTAMNPAELARLRWDEINFKSGRLSRRRWKRGLRQEVYLWKITRKAVALLPRQADLIFVWRDGRPWAGCEPVIREENGQRRIVGLKRWNFLTREFLPLAQSAGLPDVTPYTLRRTARTLAARCNDDNAARRMMGQVLAGRDQSYIKGRFPLARLRRVSLAIRCALFKRRAAVS